MKKLIVTKDSGKDTGIDKAPDSNLTKLEHLVSADKIFKTDAETDQILQEFTQLPGAYCDEN